MSAYPPKIGDCGKRSAEATLSDWDGHFAVENSSISSICCSRLPQQTDRLNALQYNGYATIERQHVTDSVNECVDSDEDNYHITHYDNDRRSKGDNNVNDAKDNKAVSVSLTAEGNRLINDDRNIWRDDRRYQSAPIHSGITDAGISRQPSSRLGGGTFSRQPTMGSSLLGDSMTEIVIEDLHNEDEPTSALLSYCKRKFLRPYLMILSFVGLNPIRTDTTIWHSSCNYLQAFLILMFLFVGYILQYLCSYRGDRGFSTYHKIISTDASSMDDGGVKRQGGVHTIGELLFGYIIPNTLHLCGFLSAVIVSKIANQEQLQNLIERVFLMSMKPRHLCRVLWTYIICGFTVQLFLSLYIVPLVLMQSQMVQVKWLVEILKSWELTMKTFLLITLFVQDLVEIIILSSYCIECYLLRIYLETLSHKLLMHSIESLEWMREVLEFRKLLDHLNQRVAIPVCFFIVMNLTYAFAGFIYLFNDFDFHYSALKVVILNIINVFLWLVLGLVPFFLAASVTRVCQVAQATGHQIRVRPFVYHNTSADDLNSTLLFASSLDMSAKLFRMPIQPNYLCFAILIVSIVVITLGMCTNLSVLGNF